MNKNLTFCEECRKDVAYYVESVYINSTLKGGKNTIILGKKRYVLNVVLKFM